MNTHWKKEDTIALCMKWCEVFLVVAILTFITGFLLQALQNQLQLDPRFGLLLILSSLGLLLLTLILELLVWKSLLKYASFFLWVIPPLGVGMAIMAYVDGKKIISKTGYTIGIWGPREITLFGKKKLGQ